MTLVLEEPPVRPTTCRRDGMPLYSTIVGPRCPICGASSLEPQAAGTLAG